VKHVLHRTIYWAEEGVIKSSLDNGSDIRIVAEYVGNITAIDISQGNVNTAHCELNWKYE